MSRSSIGGLTYGCAFQALCLSAALGQTAPPAAWSAGTTYDAGRSRVVVFGGYMRGYVGGTWEWDGTAWSRPTDTGPSARNAPGLVYDEARNQVLLFGGDRGSEGALGDTWIYDGLGWRAVAVAGPSPRSIHAMVYDTRRGRVVLFGGVAEGHTLGDTWEWDGKSWLRVASSGPPPRALHGLAYDRARGRTVLFGGQSVLGPDEPSLADTWEWDGATWARVDASPPAPRDHIAMAFDSEMGKVVVFGVPNESTSGGETWTYSGRHWTRLSDAGPRRGGARLVYDARAHRLLLYGGGDGAPTNELWSWTGTAWEPAHE
jgi:hypothetical protein